MISQRKINKKDPITQEEMRLTGLRLRNGRIDITHPLLINLCVQNACDTYSLEGVGY